MPKTGERKERQQAIEDLIADKLWIATQEEIAEHLREHGFGATQSSISRDLQQLGIRRIKGRYVRDPEHDPGRGVSALAGFIQGAIRTGPHLTVITTSPNAAQMVAEAIDREGWMEISGTLAGSDTIFVATTKQEYQDLLFERLERYLKS